MNGAVGATMWTDNETSEDLLGFRVHADLLASLVSDRAMLPVTIGLFGDWGSGKSSVMSMLERALDPDNEEDLEKKAALEGVVVLNFNGWTFEGYDDAKSALLSTILMELGDHKRFGPKVRDGAARLLKSVNWMRVAKLAVKDIGVPLLAAYATGGASLLPQAAKIFGGIVGKHENEVKSKDEHEPGESNEGQGKNVHETDWEGLFNKQAKETGPSSVRAFRKDFSKLLKESDIAALVVIIDDLDRCSPERIVENLEAIKLFLNVERTAFVIGADPRIVRHAVGFRYPRRDFAGVEGYAVADELAKDYLEKLIQVPYSLPRLSAAEVESYMTLLYCNREFTPEASAKVVAAARSRQGRERYGRFGYPEVKTAVGDTDVPAALSANLTFVKAAAPLVTMGLKGNPRQVKRFLNALMLRKRLAHVAKLELDDTVLVKLQVLEYTRDDLFVELNSWQQAGEGVAKKLADLEVLAEQGKVPDSSPWSDPFVSKWLLMEPKLGAVDLTEYFWVARDRLAAAYGATDLMPTIVKSALTEMTSGNKAKQIAAVDTLVCRMEEEERRQFLRALGNLLIAKPADEGLATAFNELVNKDVPGSAEAFVQALRQAPPDSLSASIGLEVKLLMESKELQTIFKPFLDDLAKSSSLAGRALAAKPAKGGK